MRDIAQECAVNRFWRVAQNELGLEPSRPLLQTIRSVQLARPNSYAASRW